MADPNLIVRRNFQFKAHRYPLQSFNITNLILNSQTRVKPIPIYKREILETCLTHVEKAEAAHYNSGQTHWTFNNRAAIRRFLVRYVEDEFVPTVQLVNNLTPFRRGPPLRMFARLRTVLTTYLEACDFSVCNEEYKDCLNILCKSDVLLIKDKSKDKDDDTEVPTKMRKFT